MTSQFTAPILIPSGGQSEPLEKVPLSGDGTSADYDESWLQQLLFRHPEALPIEEIDRAYSGAVPICIELNTPAGPVDALYATPQGRLVVLETKLWRNPEARRTVVGQVLDYAKELSRWTYEDMQGAVTRRTGRRGNALFDIVNEAAAELNEAEFVDEVSRSLRQGRFPFADLRGRNPRRRGHDRGVLGKSRDARVHVRACRDGRLTVCRTAAFWCSHAYWRSRSSPGAR